MRWIKILLVVSLAVSLFVAARPILHGDIMFQTDIARDFLLIEDIVRHKPITFIGPRSGGIPGVFHGPLWLYINVPAFIIGQGNPVVVGWFWYFLFVSSLVTIYAIAKKLFNTDAALLATSLFASTTATSVANFFNPFGAVIFTPVLFYFLYKYFEDYKWQYLLVSFFVMGIIIQFQMAFGVPVLIALAPYIILKLIKNKKLIHLLTAGILIFPLSTYLIFDIRHDFLQIRSVLMYIASSKVAGQQPLFTYLFSRLQGMFVDGLNISLALSFPFILPWTILFIYGLIQMVRKNKNKNFYILFAISYIGFWILCFLFKGVIWSYYFWPFLPIVCIVYGSYITHKKLKIVIYLFACIILVTNMYVQLRNSTNGQWKFQEQITNEVYKNAPEEFGYYVYTPDQYGYSTRYAMNYLQLKNKSKLAVPFQKRSTTYLLIAPPPSDKPYLNGDWWKEHQVNISSKPVAVKKYPDGFKVEKYSLTKDEIGLPSDPNLIQDLTFR